MNDLRSWLSRPAGEHPFLLAALVLVVGLGTVIALAASVGDSDDGDGRSPAATPSVPSPVIAPAPPSASATPTADPAATARPVARAFVTSYVAFLYGRAGAEDVEHVTSAVRRELIANRQRVPPALRQRRPRIVDLRVTRQAADAVLATARIDDGDVAVYPIVFTLDRADGRWRVSRLAND